jgi:predicted RNase H-like nuclease
MRFIGIDLAWKYVDPRHFSTAVCVIEEDLSVGLFAVTDDDEVLSLVPEGNDCLIGIDASLKVPNDTGMRSTEKLVRRMGINILPTSKCHLNQKFGGSRGERMVDALGDKGFHLAMSGDRNGRLLYEVYPYATVRSMMGHSPRYKHGKLAEKRQGCLGILWTIQIQHPELMIPEMLADQIIQGDSSGLRSVSDKLDSLLGAICVYRHAIYRGQATQMIGDEENGFILLCR